MKTSLIISLLLSLFSLNSFAQRVDALEIADSSFVPVFIGGWGSCDSKRPHDEKEEFGKNTPHKMFLYSQAVRYVQTVNRYADEDKGIKKFVLVCANKFSLSGALAQGTIRLLSYDINGQNISMTQKKPEIVNIDSFQDNTKSKLLRVLPFKDKRPHLTTRLLEIGNGRPLVLFGHSYGGWIGKRIIEILAAPELYEDSKKKRDRKLFSETEKLLTKYDQFPVHTFFSLEGISAVKCRIEKSIWVGVISMIGESRSKGCRSEMTSFHNELKLSDSDQLRSLPFDQTASRVTNWYNVMLKDSELPTRAKYSNTPGVQNIILDIAPFGGTEDYKKSQQHPFKNAHHMLGFETKTWLKMCEITLGDEALCNPVENVDNKGRSK